MFAYNLRYSSQYQKHSPKICYIFVQLLNLFTFSEEQIHMQADKHTITFRQLKHSSKCMKQPKIHQARTRKVELHLCLPHGWQGLKYLGHQLPPRCICRKQDSKQSSKDLNSATPHGRDILIGNEASEPTSFSVIFCLPFFEFHPCWKVTK